MSLLSPDSIGPGRATASRRCVDGLRGLPPLLMLLPALPLCALLAEPGMAAELTISPLVSVGTRYQDNIYFSSDNKESDFSTVFSPSLEVRQRDERGQVKVKAKVNTYTYAENSELDSVDPDITAQGAYALTPVVSVNAGGLYAIDYQPDRTLTTSGLISSKSKRERHEESLGLDYTLSEKTVIGGKASFGKIQYADESYSDTTSQNYTADLRHNLGSYFNETIGLIHLSHSLYDFDQSQSRASTVAVGFSRNLNERYSLTAWAGPSLNETEYPDFPIPAVRDWGTAANCSLDGKFEQSSFNLAFSYDLAPDSYSSTSVERMAWTGNYSRQVSFDLGVGLSASYFENTASGNSLFRTRDTDETSFNLSPRVKYKITDDLGLECNYQYSIVEENEDSGGRRERNSVFLRLVWNKDFSRADLLHAFD